MPRGRKRALRSVLAETIRPTDIEKEPKVGEAEPKPEPEPNVPSTVTFSIPADKVPVQVKEMSVGNEVTLQITGKISNLDETGATIDVSTIEVI